MSDLIVVVNIFLSLLSFSLIGWWYVAPVCRRLDWQRALEPLLFLHTFRHVGLMFLAPGAVKHSLPTVFAGPAAWGDLTAAILAFLAILALRRRLTWAPVVVWVFNIQGTLDLAYALAQGVANTAAAGMGAAFWIPAILVPALLVTHVLMFWILLSRSTFENHAADLVAA